MKKIILAIGLFTGLSFAATAQSNADQLKKCIQLATLGQCKEALGIVQGLLKQDSNNISYLEYNSYLLAKVWHDKEVDESQSTPYYNTALYLAKKALKKDSGDAEAHYAYAFVVGSLNEFASHKQQIANAKIMKDEIDKCLKKDPGHSGAYHLLGRWCRRLAEFSGVEKFAVKALYGASLPEATYQDAVNAFEKAVVYSPDYLIHQYELANTYYEMDKYSDAKIWLQKIIGNTTYKGDDAQNVKDKAKKLLAKMD